MVQEDLFLRKEYVISTVGSIVFTIVSAVLCYLILTQQPIGIVGYSVLGAVEIGSFATFVLGLLFCRQNKPIRPLPRPKISPPLKIVQPPHRNTTEFQALEELLTSILCCYHNTPNPKGIDEIKKGIYMLEKSFQNSDLISGSLQKFILKFKNNGFQKNWKTTLAQNAPAIIITPMITRKIETLTLSHEQKETLNTAIGILLPYFRAPYFDAINNSNSAFHQKIEKALSSSPKKNGSNAQFFRSIKIGIESA